MSDRAIEFDISAARDRVAGWTNRGTQREQEIIAFYSAANDWHTSHTDANLRRLIGAHTRLRRTLKEQINAYPPVSA